MADGVCRVALIIINILIMIIILIITVYDNDIIVNSNNDVLPI